MSDEKIIDTDELEAKFAETGVPGMVRPAFLEEARVFCFSWHSGKSSAFYAFASTGRVQSEEHRKNILDELESTYQEEYRTGRLESQDGKWFPRVRAFIEDAPIITEHNPTLSGRIPDYVYDRVNGVDK
jgi:hypothetical protein